MVTEAEKQRIIAEYEYQKKEELRQRMSQMGKSRSKKKLRAARKAIKIARAARNSALHNDKKNP